MLTILIPNWNRPRQLDETLRSIFNSILAANEQKNVYVLVVDDYSTNPRVKSVAQKYSGYSNFRFIRQDHRCGNAEVAFLSAIAHVHTTYLWLFGNDDSMQEDGISKALDILREESNVGMVLLNPLIKSRSHDISICPIITTSARVRYRSCQALFEDWGFVTSTTTFSCLIIKTDPVKQFHKINNLSSHGTVYSHTFTIYSALRNLPGIFYSDPVVTFTLNNALEEQNKLAKQARTGVLFHHHTIGLARLVNACASLTGCSLKQILESHEDELDKETLKIVPGTLLGFLSHFFLEQLLRELSNISEPSMGFGYLMADEVRLILDTIGAASDIFVSRLVLDASKIYRSSCVPCDVKTRFLREMQARLRMHSSQLREPRLDEFRDVEITDLPLKLACKTSRVFPLRSA
jgi:glycosyltransferase involved in cell wall biosynthesis